VGLVDLLTDLENFKFGMSSQEQVDEQIESSPPISSDEIGIERIFPFNLPAIQKIEINKKIEFRNGQFTQVPAGLNENNLFGTKTFREVADPYNIAGYQQPFILRPIPTEGDGTPGNGRWGFDPIPAGSGLGGFLGEAASEFIGGFFRGAPTFTGLVERHLIDKLRIGKFLLTPKGIGFIGKQFALQALNPTLESKVYNPISTLNIPLGVNKNLPILNLSIRCLSTKPVNVGAPLKNPPINSEAASPKNPPKPEPAGIGSNPHLPFPGVPSPSVGIGLNIKGC
jgi:hypothetical protein